MCQRIIIPAGGETDIQRQPQAAQGSEQDVTLAEYFSAEKVPADDDFELFRLLETPVGVVERCIYGDLAT